MTARIRWFWLGAITLVVLGSAIAYTVWSIGQYQLRQGRAAEVAVAVETGLDTGPHVLFRNTAAGAGYGHIATVPLHRPDGPRWLGSVPCDRVYAAAGTQMCLQTNAGIVTTFSAIRFNDEWQQQEELPLPGNPSRVRVSPDGTTFASTVFVTGHAYAPASFSTATVISKTDGSSYGNLEDFTLIVDGSPFAPVDRNLWGVTFSQDPNIFYATAATADKTWLVRGDLSKRTLVSLQGNAECPSISPDGKKIAYKKNLKPGPQPFWNLAVLDLASGKETLLKQPRSVDDQAEWLDNSTLLYGMPREGAVGDDDVWSTGIGPDARPQMFIEHAWSPSVVR